MYRPARPLARIVLAIALAGPATAAVAAEESLLSFPVRHFVIEGNTLVDTAELQRRLAPLRGESRQVATLLEARRVIEAAYRHAGRPLVAVGLPREFGADGTIRLRILELTVGEVTVAGNERVPADEIRRRVPALREGESPAMDDIGRQLALAGDNPALGLQVDFAPRDDRTAQATLQVTERRPWQAALLADNSGTDATGKWRTGVSLSHGDLWGLGHSGCLSYVTSPAHPDRVHQFAGCYVWPLYASGDSLSFSGSYSDVDSGRIADVFDVSGRGSSLGARYQRHLMRSATVRHTVEGGLESRFYRNTVDFFGTNFGSDVATMPVSLGYQVAVRHDTHSLSAQATVLRNLPGGARNDRASYELSRSGADANWSAWRAGGRATTALPKGFTAGVQGETQYARQPLIAGEQFGLGGARSVRGLSERAVAGDRGWRTSFELGLPAAGAFGRVAAFFDVGATQRIDALPGESTGERVSSVGLAWRIAFGSFSASADWGLVRDGAGDAASGDQRIHVSAIWQI